MTGRRVGVGRRRQVAAWVVALGFPFVIAFLAFGGVLRSGSPWWFVVATVFFVSCCVTGLLSGLAGYGPGPETPYSGPPDSGT